MKWIAKDGMVFPACRRCGEYPLIKVGKDEYGYYLMRCSKCRKVEVVKTNPHTLYHKALDRWWRK